MQASTIMLSGAPGHFKGCVTVAQLDDSRPFPTASPLATSLQALNMTEDDDLP